MAAAIDTKATEDLLCPSCGRKYPSATNGPHFFAKHVATRKARAAGHAGRVKQKGNKGPRRQVTSPYTFTIEWLHAEHDRLSQELARLDEAIAAVEALA